MSVAPLRLRAYAKVNLTLEVLGRRSDGFHDLSSVMQTISLADTIELVPGGEGLVIEAPTDWDIPYGDDNLVLRAVDAYRAASASRELRVGVRLHKRIPPAAGLGGGSSDAAATLRGLNTLNGGALPTQALLELAAGLGSDVSFFLRGGTQLAEGRGERLTPLPDLPETWFVLVTPPNAIDRKTARLFALLTQKDCSDGSHTRKLVNEILVGEPLDPTSLFNTFDAVAGAAFPGIQPYRAMLRHEYGHALLCGAGPSLFVVSGGERDAGHTRRDPLKAGIPHTYVRTVSPFEAANRLEPSNEGSSSILLDDDQLDCPMQEFRISLPHEKDYR